MEEQEKLLKGLAKILAPLVAKELRNLPTYKRVAIQAMIETNPKLSKLLSGKKEEQA